MVNTSKYNLIYLIFHLVVHSRRPFWLSILVVHFGFSFWLSILVDHFGCSFSLFILVVHFGYSFWVFILVVHFRCSFWLFILVVHFGRSPRNQGSTGVVDVDNTTTVFHAFEEESHQTNTFTV